MQIQNFSTTFILKSAFIFCRHLSFVHATGGTLFYLRVYFTSDMDYITYKLYLFKYFPPFAPNWLRALFHFPLKDLVYCRIAAEFYSLYTKDLTCPVLLKQLRSALNGSPAYSENANKKLHFSSEETRHQFISSVLLFHENVLKHASSGNHL